MAAQNEDKTILGRPREKAEHFLAALVGKPAGSPSHPQILLPHLLTSPGGSPAPRRGGALLATLPPVPPRSLSLALRSLPQQPLRGDVVK